MSKKKTIGRPPKAVGDKYETPGRRLGRVDDDEWERLQRAAEASEMTFTAWAVGVLSRAARRCLRPMCETCGGTGRRERDDGIYECGMCDGTGKAK